VESGRYRGYSTQILAEYLSESGTSVTSIDLERGTEADKAARNRLSGYDNLDLRYGDSRDILSDEIEGSAAVLIDGPKGDVAIELALDCLKREETALVAVHDLSMDRFYRDISELLFTRTFFSDNDDFVAAFRHLDDPCWDCDDIPWQEPYTHSNETVESYGPTLGLFFGVEDSIDPRVESNYRSYIGQTQQTPSLVQCVGRYLRSKRRAGGSVSRTLANATLSIGKIVLRK